VWPLFVEVVGDVLQLVPGQGSQIVAVLQAVHKITDLLAADLVWGSQVEGRHGRLWQAHDDRPYDGEHHLQGYKLSANKYIFTVLVAITLDMHSTTYRYLISMSLIARKHVITISWLVCT